MGKNYGKVLAFAHFTVTEMRPIWLLWYTVYNTFEAVVTSAAVTTAYSVYAITDCVHNEKITQEEIRACAKSAYTRYLASGPQDPFDECSAECPGSEVGILVPQPRIMFFFMCVLLFGFLLSLLLYLLYCRPNYYTGNYITFTQKLYASKPYRIATYTISTVSVGIILAGIYLLIKNGYSWRPYVIALLLMVKESGKLIHSKSEGLNTNSKNFRELKISYGNPFMRVINFFLTTNAVLLEEIEVNVMKKGLPDHVAARDNVGGEAFRADDDEDREDCSTFLKRISALFDWNPVMDKDLDKFLTETEADEGNGQEEMTQKV